MDLRIKFSLNHREIIPRLWSLSIRSRGLHYQVQTHIKYKDVTNTTGMAMAQKNLGMSAPPNTRILEWKRDHARVRMISHSREPCKILSEVALDASLAMLCCGQLKDG